MLNLDKISLPHDRPAIIALSGVRNASHLVHVNAALRALADRSAHRLTVWDLDRTETSVGQVGRTLHDDDAENLGIDVDFDFDKNEGRQPDAYIGVGAVGWTKYLPMTTKSLPPPPVIVTDEGIGSYGSIHSTFRAALRENRHRPAQLAMAAAALRTISVAAARTVFRSASWPLFHRARGSWETNPNIAAEFIRVTGTQPSAQTPSDVVAYLSQPWVKLGIITASDYRAHLENLARACELANKRMVIRSHPMDEELPRIAAELGIAVTTSGAMAEADPTIRQAAAVIGETSTALLTLSAVFQVPSIRLAQANLPNGRQWDIDSDLSKRQRSLLSTFVRTVPDYATLQKALNHAVGHTERSSRT